MCHGSFYVNEVYAMVSIMEDELVGQRTHETSFAAQCTNHSANSTLYFQPFHSFSFIYIFYIFKFINAIKQDMQKANERSENSRFYL